MRNRNIFSNNLFGSIEATPDLGALRERLFLLKLLLFFLLFSCNFPRPIEIIDNCFGELIEIAIKSCFALLWFPGVEVLWGSDHHAISVFVILLHVNSFVHVDVRRLRQVYLHGLGRLEFGIVYCLVAVFLTIPQNFIQLLALVGVVYCGVRGFRVKQHFVQLALL